VSLPTDNTPRDIGHGVTIHFVVYNGVTVGLTEEHDSPTGRCSGYVRFRVPQNAEGQGRPSWVIEKEDPLTLSPSVLCTTCGHHGFIREGRWVSA
jgi:Family of unknown function (DUF6527)